MKIAALLKFSILDYPGKISAVVFTQGCNLRCRYCHNKDFLDIAKPGEIEFSEVLSFLQSRKNQLEAVVFSGGEPLLQLDIVKSIATVKAMNFFVGLHTTGTIHEKFIEILPLVDWIGFDIKEAFQKYENITQICNSGNLVKQSLLALVNSNVCYEIRTTYDSRHMLPQNLVEIAETLEDIGIKNWIIQQCIIRNGQDVIYLNLPDSNTIASIKKFINVELRQE
ncbi:MAG: anaerobic ribonucleoside-triphosphate reductase activating protein [Holosporales bacterium]|jgi:pyruvate formate lyase activating enzyme|nr:anaerobic ribonucleoside-triphosphate reductase activating protein [Holosporales bacterium]